MQLKVLIIQNFALIITRKVKMLGRYSANGESITYYFYFFETEYNKLVLVGG